MLYCSILAMNIAKQRAHKQRYMYLEGTLSYKLDRTIPTAFKKISRNKQHKILCVLEVPCVLLIIFSE